MQSDLSPATEAFLASVVSTGAFRDRTEAIEAGIDLLRSRVGLQKRLAESKAQLDRGDGVLFDDAGLDQYFSDLKRLATTGPD
jgi:hypothetical protein